MGMKLLDTLNINAAMVDLDGTLVDTLGDFVAALNLMPVSYTHLDVYKRQSNDSVAGVGQKIIESLCEPIVVADKILTVYASIGLSLIHI